MAVKPLSDYQQQQRASSLADYQRRQKAGVRSLADYQAIQNNEIADDRRDPYLGQPVGYRLSDVGVPPGPAPQGLFIDEKDRAGFEDLIDPMYFGQATGRHFERDAADKLKAYYSMNLDLPPAFIDQHSDWITEALLGERMDPSTAGKRIADYWKNGQIHIQRSDLAMQVLLGTDTPETWAELQRLQDSFTQDHRAQFRAWWEKMLAATAEIMPYSIEGIKAAPVGASVGALAGGLAGIAAGQMGPQALLPEETVTVPAMIWSGVKLGGGMAAAYRIGQLEAGGALLELLDMGIDPAIAKAAAVGVGVLNGAIEVVQISALLNTLPGGKKLASTTIREVVNRLVKEQTFRNLAVRHAAQFGTYLTAETLQELAQESVNVTAEQLAAVLHEKLKGEKVETETIDEIVGRFREVGIKSLQGFTVLGIPGSVVSGAIDAGETAVLRGSPSARMSPDVRSTHVKIPAWTPEQLPEGVPAVTKRTPGPIAEAEALAAKGLQAARPMAETTPGQTTALPVERTLQGQAEQLRRLVVEQKQPALDQIGTEIATLVGGRWSGTPKSAASIVAKVTRKQQAGQADYDVTSPKDHARGKLELARWEDAAKAIEQLGAKGFALELTIAEPLNRFGYRGINASVAMGDGINGEVQIHTPQSWALKLETDAIYRKWRDVVEQGRETLSPEQRAAADRDMEYCRKVWSDYWATVADDIKDSISESAKGLASKMAPMGVPSGKTLQTPSSRTSQSEMSRLNRVTRPSSMRAYEDVVGIVDTSTQSISASPGVVNTQNLQSALEQLSMEALVDRAKRIGVTVKGKKAQLAALIAETIRAKVAGKQTRTERQALTETEAAIAAHPLYREYDQAATQTHRIRIDPDTTYFVEPKYKGDVEGYLGKAGAKDYNAAVGRRITFDKNKGQAWDDAVKEQGFEMTFDEFMQDLVGSIEGARAARGPGLNEAAIAEAMRSGEPELAILARKREMLRDGRSVWEINQEIHGLAAESKLDLADYERLLIGQDLAAPPGESHPGSLAYKDFTDQLGRELVDEQSPWLRRWTIPGVAESPRQMWNRLRNEWQAIAAHEIAGELNIDQVAEAARKLTPQQEAELGRIDAEAVTEQILRKHKDTIVGRLIGGMFDDAVEIKQLRQALLDAYRAGTKEGIAEARQAYRAAQQRIKARRQLREYVAKLTRIIKKPVGKSVAFSQRMAIQFIQQRVDPKFRRLDTIEKRRRSREFFAKHPEAEAPKKTMQLIESVAPNELTVAQLETIAREVSELKRKGRLLRKAEYEAIAAQRKADLDAVRESIGRPPVEVMHPVVAAPTVTMRQKLADLFRLTLTPERVLDWYDGRRMFSGKVFEIFWQRVADAENRKLARIKERLESTRKALADVGMTLADLQQPMMAIGERVITVQDAIGIYLFRMNYFSKLAVTFGNWIGEAQQKKVVAAIEADPRLLGLAQYILQHYEDHYPRLREAVIVTEDRDMGKEDNYTPMRRMERDYTPDERSMLSEMLQREHYKRGYAEKGMTLARKDIAAEHQKPIRLDAWTLLLEQIERQEHYIAFAEITKRMRAIVADEGVRAALTEKHSPAAWRWLRDYTDVVANPNIYKTWSQAENLARILRRHATIAFLSWKISTALKQVASISLYLPEAGHHLLAAGFEAATDWQKVREFVTARDPMVEFAALERELEEMRNAKPGQYKDLVRQFGEAGLKGLMWFDAPTRTIGWYGVYLAEHAKAVAEGLDAPAADKRATEAARLTTSRTQPGARAFQLPELYRTGELYNLFLQFTNQLNKLWNMATYDFAALVKNQQYSRAAMLFAAVGIQAGLIWSITHRRIPDDPEDIEEIALEGLVGLIPLVGNNIVAMQRGFGGGQVAAAEGAGAFAVNTYKAIEGLVDEGDIDLKKLEAAYRGVAPVVGLPYTGPKNLIEFGVTGNPYYLLGGLPDEPKNPKSKAAQKRRRKR